MYYQNYCAQNLSSGSYCDSSWWAPLRYAEGTSVDGGRVCVKAYQQDSNGNTIDYGSFVCHTTFQYHCYNGTQFAKSRVRNDGANAYFYSAFTRWADTTDQPTCP